MQIRHHSLNNGVGWELDLKQYVDPRRQDLSRRPVVMVPGYAMNTFILSYHPGGLSMVEYLTRDGFEVWTCNLRGQGDSWASGPVARYGLRELALQDLPRVFEYVLDRKEASADKLDVVGCSLGASFLYAYLAHHRDDHPVGAMVSIGGPLRWNASHPLMKVMFASARLAGIPQIRGTRRLARLALPLVKRMPKVLALYMNADEIDMDAAGEIVNTVDDPVPWINHQIARWMRDKDLTVAGLNVTDGLRGLDLPMLCILANADGIVPPATALSIRDVAAPGTVDVLEVGDEQVWFAHADLFAARSAAERVFEPLRAWLARPYAA